MTEPTESAVAEPASGGRGRDALLAVDGLKKHFPIKRGIIFQKQVGAVKAVDGVSFCVAAGETFGLVG